jgi:hypothetical protein
MIVPTAQQRIRSILEELENVRENLLALSDDIWLGIDHNDNEAMEQGIAFKREYNDNVAQFGQIAEGISVMVQQFTNVKSSDDGRESTTSDRTSRDRIIAELDVYQPHALNEQFTFKRPYGYTIRDYAASGLTTWRALYEDLLGMLRLEAPDIYTDLPDRPETHSRRNNPYFARDPQLLRVASTIGDEIHIEINLSAQMIVGVITTVLPLFGYQPEEMTVYLREDRDS